MGSPPTRAPAAVRVVRAGVRTLELAGRTWPAFQQRVRTAARRFDEDMIALAFQRPGGPSPAPRGPSRSGSAHLALPHSAVLRLRSVPGEPVPAPDLAGGPYVPDQVRDRQRPGARPH